MRQDDKIRHLIIALGGEAVRVGQAQGYRLEDIAGQDAEKLARASEGDKGALADAEKALTALQDKLRAQKELKALRAQEKAIAALEKRIKESKAELKTLADELEFKLLLKPFAGEEFEAESQQLLRQSSHELGRVAHKGLSQTHDPL